MRKRDPARSDPGSLSFLGDRDKTLREKRSLMTQWMASRPRMTLTLYGAGGFATGYLIALADGAPIGVRLLLGVIGSAAALTVSFFLILRKRPRARDSGS